MDTRHPPAPNPTRPHPLGDPPPPPPLRVHHTSGTSGGPSPITLALVTVFVCVLLGLGFDFTRTHAPTWRVTCPDGSTYRATSAKPTEGMLEIRGTSGRRVVLPGTCKAVQD